MAPTPASALSASSVLNYMVKSLPQRSSEDQISPLKNPFAAIALFSHACMLAVGFRLKGLGEDHRIETESTPQNVQSLPSEWDGSSTYAFRYAHAQSSMEYLVKVSRLGNKALIYGVGLGDDKTASFEIKAQDYISEGSLKEAMPESELGSKIKDVFISSGRMTDLSSLFQSNIIQKLAPGIQKAGYEDNSSTIEQPRRHEETRQPQHDPLRDDREPPARPYPFEDPLAAAPRRPMPAGDFPPPGFEDEYEIQRPLRGMPGGLGDRNPLAIGDRDLYPQGLGPNDPLRMGPGGGGFRGGGGMHPTFDDPLFGGQGGGALYDPRAPPGARYDPIGPGDGPPNLRGGPRFPGGGSGGGFGGNPFGGFGSNDFI